MSQPEKSLEAFTPGALKESELKLKSKRLVAVYESGDPDAASVMLSDYSKALEKESVPALIYSIDSFLEDESIAAKAMMAKCFAELARRDPAMALQKFSDSALDETSFGFDSVVLIATKGDPGIVREWWKSLDEKVKSPSMQAGVAYVLCGFHPEFAVEFASQIKDTAKRESVLSSSLVSWGYSSPEEALKYALAVKDDGKSAAWVINGIAKKNPEESLKIAASVPDLELRSRLLASSFQSWIAKSEDAALDWYRANSAMLDAGQADAVLESIVGYRTKTGNLESAREWLGEIQDPDARQTAEGRIWSTERDALQKEVSKEPAETLQSIVSGKSKYADYWLEEAMTTWMAKDFDTAQEWHQQNWKAMPAAKSQYVAAAFANQAVQQGDLETARQWAAYIQDEKTKQRIDAGIAKAEKGN